MTTTTTPRDMILHIIPGVSLVTDSETIVAVEAARTLINLRDGPQDAMERTFVDWYDTEYRDWLIDIFAG